MDGWETRRRRTPGHDWCVIQLGLRGIIKQADIDTNYFLGNHPPFASLDALCLTNGFPSDASAVEGLSWTPILEKSPLDPGSQNLFAITSDQTWTHLRLNIIPDGGVARLRVYGVVVPDWSKLKPGELASLGVEPILFFGVVHVKAVTAQHCNLGAKAQRLLQVVGSGRGHRSEPWFSAP